MKIARRIKFLLGGVVLASTALTAVPAAAQEDAAARIKKLEAEVRALQRKVFPGGDGRYFEPEIPAPTTSMTTTTTTPATTAVTDILVRLDAIEAQLQRLTAQVEENGNSVRELDTRLSALEVTTQAAQDAATGPAMGPPDETPATSVSAPAAPVTVTTSPAAVAATPVGPSAERLAAVQAIAKPQTDDAGDDEYSYGFRLWSAGFYPEAQQQLALFLEKYPSHERTTWGRNLLGRAYLDDGQPREAAGWFLKNYQADKQSARAPDSLLFLAESMIALSDTGRACIALAEFGETYPALASGRLQDQYERNRSKVTCN